jgi:hypothetical protein
VSRAGTQGGGVDVGGEGWGGGRQCEDGEVPVDGGAVRLFV